MMKAPDRVEKIAKFVAEHFQETVEPKLPLVRSFIMAIAEIAEITVQNSTARARRD